MGPYPHYSISVVIKKTLSILFIYCGFLKNDSVECMRNNKIFDIGKQIMVINADAKNVSRINATELRKNEIYGKSEEQLFDQLDNELEPFSKKIQIGSYKINNKEHTTSILTLDENTGIASNATHSPTINDEFDNDIVSFSSKNLEVKSAQYVTNPYLVKDEKKLILTKKLPKDPIDPRNIMYEKNKPYVFKTLMAKIIEQNKIMKQYHYHNAMNAISKNTYENNLAASVSKKSNKETIIYNKDGDAEKVLEFLKIFK